MVILLKDCAQMSLPPEHSPSLPTSLSSWSKTRTVRKGEGSRRCKSGREQEKSERGRDADWETWRKQRQKKGLSKWRGYWGLYLKDCGCLRELNLPHIVECEGQDESCFVILPVGVQAALAVQWLYATYLLLRVGLFFWAWHPHQISLHWETGEWIATARYWVETARGCGSNGQGSWWDWRCNVSVCGELRAARSRDTSWLLCVRCRDIYVGRARHIKGSRLCGMCARAQDGPPPPGNFKVQSSCSVWRYLQAVQPWIGLPLWRDNQLARAPFTSPSLDWPAQCLRLSLILTLSYLTGTLSVLSVSPVGSSPKS